MDSRNDAIHFSQFQWNFLAERPFHMSNVIQTEKMQHQQTVIVLLQFIHQNARDIPVALTNPKNFNSILAPQGRTHVWIHLNEIVDKKRIFIRIRSFE